MFCPQCGKEIKDGVKFCVECGWAVPDAPVQNVQPVVLPSAMQTVTPTAMPQNLNTGFVQTIAADEKFCSSCGSVIKKIAEICPKCGVRQETNSVAAIKAKEYDNAVISTFFLGTIGLILAILTFLFPSFFLFQDRGYNILLCFMCPISGLVSYIRAGRKSAKKGMVTAGLIVCIVGVIAAISLVVFGLIS
jgi:predicted RNA-binding Zn-ribbon protein involved in translation (DUF1610 family)